MPGSLDVLVLGDVNPDLVLRGENVEPAFGQAERLLDEAHLTVGGSGAILACGAARLGLTVGICGVVGDDLFGRYLREELTERGVDVRGVVTDPERPTGLTVVLSQPDDRGMLTVPGTIGALTAAAIDPELLASAGHVHVSSYFLQTALRPDLPAIFDRVHEVGGTTSIDPNWDPSDAWDGGLLDVLAKTDIFLPNAIEATRIARTSDVEAAVRSLAMRAGLVVVKEGPRGAIAGGSGAMVRAPAVTTTVLDTTGAGDAFDAGFLAAWLRRGLAGTCAGDRERLRGAVDARRGRRRRPGDDGGGARGASGDGARLGAGRDRVARRGVEQVDPRRVDGDGNLVADAHAGGRIDAHAYRGASGVAVRQQHRVLLLGPALGRARVDGPVDDHVVAERLDHLDAHRRVDVVAAPLTRIASGRTPTIAAPFGTPVRVNAS